MKLFFTRNKDHRVVPVFARSKQKALELVSLWRIANGESLEPPVELSEYEIINRGEDPFRDEIKEALKIEASGIGTYNREDGWKIIPPGEDESIWPPYSDW
ncbi:hypothetical protein [Novosphingopyxis sp. YJ-S2-01]|uniref:hypothetical protein n=1 Tax=Novosphingopyxis sp. YJ-S2-01 TaxID=2794021 RepID=UPI0018DD5BAE|nr:hypothetical protein [Novosphingopyxis sp. YJ-S2-01]MBH9537200.1 hypothetical protein [Novosphingopyxis sp. YJ-S2-01]